MSGPDHGVPVEADRCLISTPRPARGDVGAVALGLELLALGAQDTGVLREYVIGVGKGNCSRSKNVFS